MLKKSDNATIVLQPNEVHLWCVNLRKLSLENNRLSLCDQSKILSIAELSRANQFVKPSDQHNFIKSKMATRKILSRYLSCAPREIQFIVGNHGKPMIAASHVQFNTSDAGDYLLLGVTLRNAIGVDIEYEKKQLDFLALAKRFFAVSEYHAIASLPSSEQKAAFYRCWTRKEAYMKAIGTGLSYGLANFEVSLQAEYCVVDAFTVRSINVEQLICDAGTLSNEGYYAAFAIKGMVVDWKFQKNHHFLLT